MAQRKAVIDTSMLQGLVEGASHQELQRGNPKSTDPKFPVFSTPVNEDIIVYIPRTNMRVDENGEDMAYLSSLIHDGRLGRQFVNFRCISGLTGNPAFDQLGYDGTCPACDAVQEAWELYRLKLDQEARRLGVDPQNDPGDTLKPVREKILREMDLKNAEEFVTFPIVIIPTKGKFQPADDATEKMQVVFVTWRKKRYQDSILAGLDQLMTNPGHPAGLFWYWKFSYDTQGRQATAMQSARNAKYNVITDGQALEVFNKFKSVAEEKAKEFTLLKAAEVVVANQFITREDLEVEVNKVMSKTRSMLELAKTSGTPQLGAGQDGSQVGGASNPLAGFGVAPQGNLGAEGQATPQEQPAQEQPAQAGGTSNPVSFG